MLRSCAALLAVTSAALHVATAATGGAAPAAALVLLAMGLVCLPCALHLVLLRRRRAWAQAGLVAAAMLVAHPLLGPGAHVHAGGPAQDVLGAAMVLAPALGLVLAGAGLLLPGRGPHPQPA